MKIRLRYSIYILSTLIYSYSLSQYTNDANAVNKPNNQIEFTKEQKMPIFEKVQNEYRNVIRLDLHQIINQEKLTLDDDHLYHMDSKKRQEFLSQINTYFTWLKSIALISIDLSALPDFIGNLTNLINLRLINTNLTTLPDSIRNLTNLRILWLSNNRSITLPYFIEDLKNLEILNLSNNALTALPDSIRNLTNLTDLSLDYNAFTTLPDSIRNLTNLRRLDLRNNAFTSIPAFIKNIPNLTLLDLSNNPYLLPRSDNPLELGKEELRAHFGDRVILEAPSLEYMSASTTKEEVYKTLDENPLRINRNVFATNKLPDIQVEKVFEGEEMLQTLEQIIASMNFTDDQKPGYISYEMLANDFESDAQNQNISNSEKVSQYVMPRLTGYIKRLYNLPLEEKDVEPWKMYEAQIPETQKALTFVMEKIKNHSDPDQKMLLFNLLVNGLLHCPTGQTEGVNSIAYALLEGGYQTNNFKDNLKRFLAIKKNSNFTTAILAKGAKNSQNVHLISSYRDRLKEELGLTSVITSYQERMGILGEDPFRDNEWNVIQVFYNLVSPNRLIDWVIQASQTKQDYEDELKLLRIRSQNLPRERAEKEINYLRFKTNENRQFRPFTTSVITGYLFDQQLISHDNIQENWKKYFTADPTDTEGDFAALTRDGAKAILIHEGFLIEDSKNEQIIIDNNIIAD